MRKNDLHIFVFCALDRWPLDLSYAPIVIVGQGRVSANLEVSIRLYGFEKIGGAGRTDRQTDGLGATLNEAPATEDHITNAWKNS